MLKLTPAQIEKMTSAQAISAKAHYTPQGECRLHLKCIGTEGRSISLPWDYSLNTSKDQAFKWLEMAGMSPNEADYIILSLRDNYTIVPMNETPTL